MKHALLALLVLATLTPYSALAVDSSGSSGTQSDSTAFVPLTSIPGIESAGNAETLPDFLNNLYKLAIGVAAVLAVLQIVRAGVMYMGGDSITEKKDAKNLIALSVGGLILVLSPVIVFSIINPSILSLKIGGLDKLTETRLTEGSGVASTSPEDRGICEGYVDPTYVILPADESCLDVKGAGWTKLNGFCCPIAGTPQESASCCAKSSTYVPPAPEPGDAGTFTFKLYSSYSEANADGSRYPTCNLITERTFTSLESCEVGYTFSVEAFQDKTTYPDYAVAKTCSTATEAGTPAPVASWTKINALPTCGGL